MFYEMLHVGQEWRLGSSVFSMMRQRIVARVRIGINNEVVFDEKMKLVLLT
jgi:hypothetical protein